MKLLDIFKPCRKVDERWYYKHRQRAIALRKRLVPLLLIAFTLGIILTVGGYIIGKHYYIRNQQVQIISALILETNPSFDPVYVEATAEYIVDNSGNYNPVFLAVVAKYEGQYIQDNESHAGAEGFWMNLPTKETKRKYSKDERLTLGYQLLRAKQDLDDKYEKGYCISKGKCGVGKQTAYGMHNGYVGAVKNRHIANEYIAKIYTKYADIDGFIWKKRPKN